MGIETLLFFQNRLFAVFSALGTPGLWDPIPPHDFLGDDHSSASDVSAWPNQFRMTTIPTGGGLHGIPDCH